MRPIELEQSSPPWTSARCGDRFVVADTDVTIGDAVMVLRILAAMARPSP